MASISIPRKDLPVFKKISELGKPQFNSLVSALGNTKPTVGQYKFAEAISSKVKSVKPGDIAEILRVVFILYSVKARTGVSPQVLAGDVGKSCVELSSKDNQFNKQSANILSNRLGKLLSLDKTVAITSKAGDVLTEHKHTFCSARILSDIRPVFSEKAESAPAAVIIHNLQIGFHDGGTGEHQEFYVALDTDDIQALKEVIERAEKKTIVLESILKRSKVQYLEV